MYITRKAYEEIINTVPDYPPEIGGILGGYDDIICCSAFDHGMWQKNQKKCHYTPDVEYLNSCIADWEASGIDFYGIFHTHFFGIDTLSEGDRQYIEKIMRAMPETREKLYFPVVVLPERKIISYVCRRKHGKTEIAEDSIYLIERLKL
jgi:hypothetical protein